MEAHAKLFCVVCLLLVIFKVNGFDIPITYLDSAVAKGAVCLDGSAPAYHFDTGFGNGIKNWLVYLQGGGWCSNVTECAHYAKSEFGSSKIMKTSFQFAGSRSNDSRVNPDFYNWNRIVVRYCDGSSFTGDVETVDPATNVHFRGARIFKAMVDELLGMGMNSSDRVVLTGGSAGGLASIHHCDRLRTMLPSNSTLKCVSDAGYFVNIKDITGAGTIEALYDQLVATHASATIFPSHVPPK